MADRSVNEYLTEAILAAIEAKFGPERARSVEVVIEKPKQKSFGDCSTPVAMSLAKTLRANPASIARDIMSAFSWDERFVETDSGLENSIVGGYINFKLSRPYLYDVLTHIVNNPATFGRAAAAHPKKILFEFVSANPTGPMVVVNGRAAAIGDVMARVNEWLGHSVEREFYVNDYGNQVELLGKSIACRYFQEKGVSCEIPEGGYEGEYIKDLARHLGRPARHRGNGRPRYRTIFSGAGAGADHRRATVHFGGVRRPLRPMVQGEPVAWVPGAGLSAGTFARTQSYLRKRRRDLVYVQRFRRREGPCFDPSRRQPDLFPVRPCLSRPQGLARFR
jgi:arginyl-tRNA synthetase